MCSAWTAVDSVFCCQDKSSARKVLKDWKVFVICNHQPQLPHSPSSLDITVTKCLKDSLTNDEDGVGGHQTQEGLRTHPLGLGIIQLQCNTVLDTPSLAAVTVPEISGSWSCPNPPPRHLHCWVHPPCWPGDRDLFTYQYILTQFVPLSTHFYYFSLNICRGRLCAKCKYNLYS